MGHGVRERQVLGPLSASGKPEQVVLLVRRYRCRGCGAIVMSMPRGMLRRMLYGAVAVGMALALWVQGAASAAVRQRVSPWLSVVSQLAARAVSPSGPLALLVAEGALR